MPKIHDTEGRAGRLVKDVFLSDYFSVSHRKITAARAPYRELGDETWIRVLPLDDPETDSVYRLRLSGHLEIDSNAKCLQQLDKDEADTLLQKIYEKGVAEGARSKAADIRKVLGIYP